MHLQFKVPLLNLNRTRQISVSSLNSFYFCRISESLFCETDVDEDNKAVEGDSITHSCSATYRGRRNASLQWYDEYWRQQLTLPMNPARGRLSITYRSTANAPKISILNCVLCEWMHDREGREQCFSTNDTCNTKPYGILCQYSKFLILEYSQ